MSVLEIEKAISKLPSKDKKKLARDLAVQLEDFFDAIMIEEALAEKGKRVFWKELQKEMDAKFNN